MKSCARSCRQAACPKGVLHHVWHLAGCCLCSSLVSGCKPHLLFCNKSKSGLHCAWVSYICACLTQLLPKKATPEQGLGVSCAC